jgi:hypothetical protein
MPRTKKAARKPYVIRMPKGFYLKRGIWYKRIHKPHPRTGVWGLYPESTRCKENERQAAIAYVQQREEELKKSFRLGNSVDPGKTTMDELFDGLLASVHHEPTKRNYDWVLRSVLRPYFGAMLASQVTVEHCRAFRIFRRTQRNRYGNRISHTTINRDLSKVSQAFKIGMKLGTIHSLPPGGCDFQKKPETQNTRRVRLPDHYYEFFRDVIHPALRCAFVLAYNVGRRMANYCDSAGIGSTSTSDAFTLRPPSLGQEKLRSWEKWRNTCGSRRHSAIRVTPTTHTYFSGSISEK